jgi:tetratricopeptide (TPR) repeat protein
VWSQAGWEFVHFSGFISGEAEEMRMSGFKLAATVIAQFLVLAVASAPASAVFDEPKKGGEQADAPAATPAAQAALEAGLAAVKEAEAAAEGAASPGRKLPAEAKRAYTTARAKFEEATKEDPNLSQAWNGLGYSSRKLGNYKAALAAYDKAIELRPGYPEATEYRGEAYLALNRTEDAKQAYLDLFSANRTLAAKLLESMKAWIATNRKSKSEDASDLEEFVTEREQIAAQTAALTREAATQGWN